MAKEQKQDGIFKTYGVYEDVDSTTTFTRNEDIGDNTSSEYLKKLTTARTDDIDIEFVNPNKVRKTMLRRCNNWLDIKYTISVTEEKIIKSYIYYIDDQLAFSFLCKGRNELTLAMQFFKLISQCHSKSELKDLVVKYQSLLTFV